MGERGLRHGEVGVGDTPGSVFWGVGVAVRGSSGRGSLSFRVGSSDRRGTGPVGPVFPRALAPFGPDVLGGRRQDPPGRGPP